MLESRSIPQYQDDAEDWHRFLYKAAKGSVKAPDMLSQAKRAYMIDVTGDPTAPDTLHLNDYAEILRQRFPDRPFQNVADVVELGCSRHWFSRRFQAMEKPRLAPGSYQALWIQQRTVDWTALVNDAVFLCLERWSADHCRECCDVRGLDYDSREVVAGMLYLSLTWPDRSAQPVQADG